MSDKENKSEQGKEIVPLEQNKLENLFKITDELTGEAVCKSNCKLCNSIHRDDAEAKFMASGNYFAVYKFLDGLGEKISPNAVRNHLENHFMKPLLELRMKDYADDLKGWLNNYQSKEQRLEGYLTLIDRQIHMLNANTDNTNSEQMRKNSDAVVKLMKEATNIEEILEKHREGMQPIMIFIERFRDTIRDQLQSLESAEARMALVQILESIEKDVEGIM
tara:strand:+ start:6819 stop:7478 length:660 start_codon:yes stop_codon:yes gene_type:complete